MAEVVSLRMDGVIDGGPEPEIIETLERYLKQARAGEVVAIGMVLVRPNGVVATDYFNPSVWLHHIKSGAATLGYRLDAENGSAN
jgi:hypothetical protein